MAVAHDSIFPGVNIAIDERAVRVSSDAPLAVLSSAVVNGGIFSTRHIINMHVVKGYNGSNPENDLHTFARECGIAESFIGLMTAAWTQNAGVAIESHDGLQVVAVVTIGLSNAMCAGVSLPMAMMSAGTINTIVLIDGALTPAAMANAIIMATEAKTMTLVEWDEHTRDGHRTSGTSTDSVVIACTGRGDELRYAGPATTVGYLIARAVRRAFTLVPRK